MFWGLYSIYIYIYIYIYIHIYIYIYYISTNRINYQPIGCVRSPAPPSAPMRSRMMRCRKRRKRPPKRCRKRPQRQAPWLERWHGEGDLWLMIHEGFLSHGGTPKSSILIGFSIINHGFLGIPYLGKPPYPI